MATRVEMIIKAWWRGNKVRKQLLVIVFDGDILVCDLYLGYEKLEQLLRTTSAQQHTSKTPPIVCLGKLWGSKQRQQTHCDSP